MGDKLGSIDSLFVGLETPDHVKVDPRHPCVQCGKETKEHHPEERTLDDGIVVSIPRRICSSKSCRHIVYPTAKGQS